MEGVSSHGPKKLILRRRHFSVIEKYVEDVKQDEKSVPDLLESIMRPTDSIKAKNGGLCETRANFVPSVTNYVKTHRIRGFNFLDVLKSDGFPPEANTAFSPMQ